MSPPLPPLLLRPALSPCPPGATGCLGWRTTQAAHRRPPKLVCILKASPTSCQHRAFLQGQTRPLPQKSEDSHCAHHPPGLLLPPGRGLLGSWIGSRSQYRHGWVGPVPSKGSLLWSGSRGGPAGAKPSRGLFLDEFKAPGQSQKHGLSMLIAAAVAAGWVPGPRETTEEGKEGGREEMWILSASRWLY